MDAYIPLIYVTYCICIISYNDDDDDNDNYMASINCEKNANHYQISHFRQFEYIYEYELCISMIVMSHSTLAGYSINRVEIQYNN